MGHILHNFFAPVPSHTPLFYSRLVIGLLIGFGALALLQAAPRQYRKGIIALFTFLGGVYYVAEFFWPASPVTLHNPLTRYNGLVANITTVVSSFAMGLGVISLLQLHTRNIARRRAGWGNSAVLIVSFLAMTVFGLLNEYAPARTVIPHLPFTHGVQTNADIFHFLFNGGLVNLSSAMFSIIAFYIASAAYRAFRIRSLEAAFLMIAALIVMLGSVTLGTYLTHAIPTRTPTGAENPWANLRIENIANWLLTLVNSAAQRGILFGLTVGGLAVSLRLWLSLERGTYFDAEL